MCSEFCCCRMYQHQALHFSHVLAQEAAEPREENESGEEDDSEEETTVRAEL